MSGAPVRSLKLEFSKAADATRIGRLFDPAVKGAFDPQDFVARRVTSAFNKAVADGCAAFLADSQGHVRTLTVAYHLHDTQPAKGQHDNIELGTTASDIQGYKSSVPVIAALALREWFNHAPRRRITADIKQSNGPSVAIYVNQLGWQKAGKDDKALEASSWRTIPLDSDPTGQKGHDAPPAKAESMDWYACGDAALVRHAQVLLAAINRGGIVNARTGGFIPVDFSALDAEGLTRTRLEALAKGEVSRQKLKAMP